MVRVLIADDHKITVDGIKALLSRESDITVVGNVDNGAKAIQAIREQEVDVLAMDISNPALKGIEAAQEIKKSHPQIKILALIMQEDEKYFNRIMDIGFSGYIVKNSEREELIRAIRMLYLGQNYSTNSSNKTLMNQRSWTSEKSLDQALLTKREIEVLKLITEEFRNHEIAEKLFVSTRTVDTHRRNLLQKLEAKNTAGLVKYALVSGLVEAY